MSGQIKITTIRSKADDYFSLFNPNFAKWKKKGNVCCACGKTLKDSVSKSRGYGPECWKQQITMIVLDIKAVE